MKMSSRVRAGGIVAMALGLIPAVWALYMLDVGRPFEEWLVPGMVGWVLMTSGCYFAVGKRLL